MAVGGFAIARRVGQFFSSTVDAALEFETAFTGVRKTVDASEAEFARLEADFRGLSKEIPASAAEISRVAEVSGQLGVAADEITVFTKTMIDLGETTNLSAEEAAVALARFANITELPADQVERLGSAIVDLGNNFATTEREITEFGTRIAGAGKLAGLTEADILAIGAAMSSVGIEAEAGGTAVQKVLLGMTQSVAETSEELEVFADTAGLSAEEFARLFREDASEAFRLFVEGLGRQGDRAFITLENLNLQDQRLIRSFLSLAGAGDLLTRTLQTGNQAFEENTALTIEAEKRYQTNAAQLEIMRNKFNDLKIEIGGTLANALIPLLDALSNIPAPALAAGAAILGIGAGAIAIVKVIETFRILRTTLGTLPPAVATFGKALGRLGIAAGIAIGVKELGERTADFLDRINRGAPEIDRLAGLLADLETPLARIFEIGRFDPGLLGDLASLKDGFLFLEGPLDRVRQGMDDVDQALSQLVAGGAAEAAREQFARISQELIAQGAPADRVALIFDDYTKALEAAGAQSKVSAAALKESGDAAGDAAPQVDTLTEDTKDLVAEFEDLGDAAGQFGEAIEAALSPLLDLEEAEDRLIELKRELREQLDENGGAFKGNSEAALDNRESLRGLVEQAASLIEQQIIMGETTPEQAQRDFLAVVRDLTRQFPEAKGKLAEYARFAESRFPQDLATNVSVETRQAKREFDAFIRRIQNTQVSVDVTLGEFGAALARAGGLASGGTIIGARPTADGGVVTRAASGLNVGPRRAGDLLFTGEFGPELIVGQEGGVKSREATIGLLTQALRRAFPGGGGAQIVVNEVAQDPGATAIAVAQRLGLEAVR